MAEKPAASRSLLQATYTPIKVEKVPPEERPPERAWEKWRLIALLRMTLEEAETLEQRLKVQYKRSRKKDEEKRLEDALKTIKTIISILPEVGTPNALEHVKLFREMSAKSLTIIAQELITLRKERAQKTGEDLRKLSALYMEGQARKLPPESVLKVPEGWKRLEGAAPSLIPIERETFYFEKSETLPPRKRGEAGEAELETREIQAAMMPPAVEERPTPTPEVTLAEPPIANVLAWAQKENSELKTVESVSQFLSNVGMSTELTGMAATAIMDAWIHQIAQLVDGFQERMEIEPVGFLHLEKLTFTPAGIERGELVYSIPLAPGEEVNIAHKEWSNTSEEFEEIAQDFFEEYSEEGVAEKNEMAESTNSQKQHSSGFNTGVTASGGYGPVSITATASYNVNDSATKSEQNSRNQSASVTRKASSRTKKEHKISFKVASASGVEEQAVRKIVNPDEDNAKRADYYQLIRKWRVDLYRYGVRLTYDLTIPEPGSDILSKIVEIKELDVLLETEFDFPLDPNMITRDNYLDKAAEYNATVEPPPDEYKWIDKAATHQWLTRDEAELSQFFTLETDVDDAYEVIEASREYVKRNWPGEDWSIWVQPVTDFLGKSGHLVMGYRTRYLVSFFVELKLTLRLRDEAYRRWQLKAWESIRSAAEASYLKSRQRLKERRSRLVEDLGVQDALTLRKIEREEVMKGVLRWLFGPTFEFVPAGLPANLYAANAAVANDVIWSRVLSFGEFIKFLHQAIEWENMLYFLYPYFWSHQTRWELKKYLDHPDSMHQVFLKSGSARVVLTIRPGFEEDFLSVLETGIVGELPSSHPYLKISDEIRAYAETHYPGIPAANPIVDARPLIYPKQKAAWEDMQKLFQLLEAFRADNERYPTQEEGITALEPYVTPDIPEVPLIDPWGNEYVYTFPGLYGEFDLLSLGADGESGGNDEDADITSWASASLIGTWYEYTPTSAMDIEFGEEQPSA